MNNLFDTDNYADAVPSELVVGSLWGWKRSDITAVYPTASYTLNFRITGLDSPFTEYTVEASKTGGEHVVTLTDTDSYAAGDYRWFAVVTRDSDSATVQVDEGLLTVRPASGQDDSHAYRTLMAIRATLEGTATSAQRRVEIAGRVLENYGIAELLQLEATYMKRWSKEKADLDRKSGRAAKSRVLVKMEA